ncbi:MAG: glycosyltransferase family 39 protein [Phycisphaerae bacterium]|nr:glycosyltransferase family 39 protein [Phycisphaerae bacterium]
MEAPSPTSPPRETTATPTSRTDSRGWPARLALIVILALGALLTTRYSLKQAIPFADTLTYLEPGRNLIEGRGFITRFNVVYGWSGRLSHPGLAYYNPLYGLGLAAVQRALQDEQQLAIAATVAPCLLNVVLLHVLLGPSFGRLTAVMSAAGYLLFASTYLNLALISADHLVVTFCLALLLMVDRLVPRNSRYWALVGLMLGVGTLIKVTIIVLAPALMVGLFLTQDGAPRERARRSAKPAALFVAGLGAFLLAYNLICLGVTGRFYPEYPAMARNWSMSVHYGGEFVEDSPAVRPDTTELPGIGRCVGIVLGNAAAMSAAVSKDMWVFLLTSIVTLWALSPTRHKSSVYLFLVGAAFLGAYTVAFYWLPLSTDPGGPRRYALHTVAFWYPLGVAGIVHLAGKLRAGQAARTGVVVAAWIVASLPGFSTLYENQTMAARRTESRMDGLVRVMMAARNLTEPNDLVAVGDGLAICGAMLLDRPVVALPSGQLDNEANLRRFMAIFKPRLVLPGSCHSVYAVLGQMAEYDADRIPSYNPDKGPLVVFKQRRARPGAATQAGRQEPPCETPGNHAPCFMRRRRSG